MQSNPFFKALPGFMDSLHYCEGSVIPESGNSLVIQACVVVMTGVYYYSGMCVYTKSLP